MKGIRKKKDSVGRLMERKKGGRHLGEPGIRQFVVRADTVPYLNDRKNVN